MSKRVDFAEVEDSWEPERMTESHDDASLGIHRWRTRVAGRIWDLRKGFRSRSGEVTSSAFDKRKRT